MKKDISIVIPLLDEEESLSELNDWIKKVLTEHKFSYEVLFIDDNEEIINYDTKAKLIIDLCELDDKNYHNSIRFTFFAQNIRGEIARGGRYIIKNLDVHESATGFTCYMDTIMRASLVTKYLKKIMNIY